MYIRQTNCLRVWNIRLYLKNDTASTAKEKQRKNRSRSKLAPAQRATASSKQGSELGIRVKASCGEAVGWVGTDRRTEAGRQDIPERSGGFRMIRQNYDCRGIQLGVGGNPLLMGDEFGVEPSSCRELRGLDEGGFGGMGRSGSSGKGELNDAARRGSGREQIRPFPREGTYPEWCQKDGVAIIGNSSSHREKKGKSSMVCIFHRNIDVTHIFFVGN